MDGKTKVENEGDVGGDGVSVLAQWCHMLILGFDRNDGNFEHIIYLSLPVDRYLDQICPCFPFGQKNNLPMGSWFGPATSSESQ